MITAIAPVSILLDILIPNDEFCGASAEALENKARIIGPLIISSLAGLSAFAAIV